MYEDSRGLPGPGPACGARAGGVRAAERTVPRRRSGVQMLQYGLVAGFVSTAILSAISSLGIDLGALFWSLASDVRTVTSSF